MPSKALLHEAQQLKDVSGRLELLADEHPPSRGCNSLNLRNDPQHCHDSGSARCYKVGWRPADLIRCLQLNSVPTGDWCRFNY